MPPLSHRQDSLLQIQFHHQGTVALPLQSGDAGLLASFLFCASPEAPTTPADIGIRLGTQSHPAVESWHFPTPVHRLRFGDVVVHRTPALELACVEIDEPGDGDIETAARLAYAQLREHLARSDYPHLLRIWNYLDAVTEGDGDAERYRRFCVGRVAGMGDLLSDTWPAATCIGRHDGIRRLQVYWLASRHPGTPLENPRQLSAYRYPRQYGPQAPTFARALLPDRRDGLPLLISGTAAITGHQSLHPGDVQAQLEETLVNLQALIDVARTHRPDLPAHLGAGSPLKVYVRHRHDIPTVADKLSALLPAEVPRLLLHGEICRAELLVEIEAMHG